MVQPDYPEPLDAHVRKIVSGFDANRREAFEERAAIIEEGNPGMRRVNAERLAVLDVLANDGSLCPVHLLRVDIAGSTDWVLTTDVDAARAALTELGGKHIVEVSLDDAVRRDFGDLAVLSTPPW